MKDISNMICDIYNYHNITWDTTYPDGQLNRIFDNTLFKTLLPNYAFTPIKTAIKHTVEWFNNCYPNIRL